MTPHDLIAGFDVLAEAPDGVERLRELVLQLAVRGQLVPQDPTDEPASELLARIATEKSRLVKAGRIAQQEPPLPVGEDKGPFAVPTSWCWTRFEDVADTRLGKMLDKAKNRGPLRPYLRNANVQWFRFVLDDVQQLRIEHDQLRDCTVHAGDLVICEGGEPGRASVCGSEVDGMVIQKALHRARPWCGISPWFLAYLLRCDASNGRLAQLFTGATIKHLTGKALAQYMVPLPPLAEQHRIVARVDELLGLLDRLETAHTICDTTRAAVRDSAFDALREADTAAEVEVAWNRFAERLDDLLCEPADIDPLRQAVLQLAVRGKLVPQDSASEPASVLLARIAAEKARLVKAGKIRRARTPSPLSEDEVPFNLPSGWSLVRFGELFLTIFTGPFGTSLKKAEYHSGGTPVINPQNLRAGAIAPSEDTCVGAATLQRLKGFRMKERDVVVARRGEMGRCAVAGRSEDGWLCGTGSLVLRPPIDIDAHFVTLFLRSPWTVRRLSDDSVGATMRNLNQRIMVNLPLGLPPLAEQHRIVARVDELMGLLDRLEERLQAARTAQATFAAAAVHHLDA